MTQSIGPLRTFSKTLRSVDQEHLITEVPTPRTKHAGITHTYTSPILDQGHATNPFGRLLMTTWKAYDGLSEGAESL